MTRGLFHCF